MSASRLSATRPDSCWDSSWVLVRMESISSRRSCTSVSSVFESMISWVNSPLRSASTWVTCRVADSSWPQLGVARGDRVRQPGQALQRRPHLVRGVGEGLGHHLETAGQLRGVDVVDRRGQVGEGLDDVVGRRRPLQRDRLVGVELAGAARHQGHVLGAEHGLDLDGRLGAVPHEGVLDADLDQDGAVLEREALDLADLHAGDAHRVVGLEAGRLGELRLVDGAAADQRQATAR